MPDSSQVRQQGLAPNFNAAPEALNTDDLIIDGATALLALNGQSLASLQ